MADQEAWLELCDLYISQQEWNKAAFCVEELMLHSPFNHLYLQRYAEIKYTQVCSHLKSFDKITFCNPSFCVRGDMKILK